MKMKPKIQNILVRALGTWERGILGFKSTFLMYESRDWMFQMACLPRAFSVSLNFQFSNFLDR